MTRPLNHDENQFVVSGYLLGRQELIPYRDFPFFHTPYLVAIDALVARCTSHLLLGARLVCMAFGIGTVALLCRLVIRATNGGDDRMALWPGWSIAGLLFLHPLFIHTTARAWNHDIPVFCTLLGFVFLRRGVFENPSIFWIAAAGFCAALATGTRSTFALTMIGLAAAIFCAPQLRRQSIRQRTGEQSGQQLALLVGFLIGILPCAGLFLLAPRNFLFGNFVYPFLNLQWRHAEGVAEIDPLRRKLFFLVSHLLNQPAGVATCVLFGMAIVQVFRNRAHQYRWEVIALALLVASLFLGGVIPTPSFETYYYAPVPFAFLAAGYAIGGSTTHEQKIWKRTVLAALIVSLPVASITYFSVMRSFFTEQWYTTRLHNAGLELASLTRGLPILTLAPIVPAESGLWVYPDYSTGPFAFRVAPFVSAAERAIQHLPDRQKLRSSLKECLPAAALISGEGEIEKPLIHYAHSHGLPILFLGRDDRLTFPPSQADPDVHR